MSIAILMDHHVPRALTLGLRQRKIDVLTAEDVGAHKLPDPELMDLAGTMRRILVSQDRDLIIEAVRRQRSGQWFSGLIWGAQLSETLRRTLDDMELVCTAYEPDEIACNVVRLPL